MHILLAQGGQIISLIFLMDPKDGGLLNNL
jgi:hypothetical protein